MKFFIETERLQLRWIELSDYPSISAFLQDAEVMYAWEEAFSDQEVSDWIAENIRRYDADGYSYYSVLEKSSGKLIGVAGILSETVNQEQYIGLGYIFHKDYWKKGYAYESAFACMDYAFQTLGIQEITAQIRPTNYSSIQVATRLGMAPKMEFVKVYKGKQMPHILFAKSR